MTNNSPAKVTINERFVSGRLNAEDYKFLKLYLKKYEPESIKDTVIIRYDFNYGSCWHFLDEESSRYINRVLSSHRTLIRQFKDIHKGTSVYEFREKGDNINKYKLWDPDILIDSSYHLLNLIIQERTVCGTTMMILPTGQFIKIKNDPHTEILYLTKEQITQLLQTQKNAH